MDGHLVTGAAGRDALGEPTRRVGPAWVAGVVLVNLGINAAIFGPINVLLGLQAIAFDEMNKEAVLSLVTACGAAIAVIANPLFGALSDRTVSQLGRRVPWILGGVVLGAAALLAIGWAPNLAAMVLLWCVVQVGINAAYASITATVPDRVPLFQRASVGGLAAMGQTLGILCGAVIGAVVLGNFAAGYVICAFVLLACVIPYALNSHDARLPIAMRPPFRLGRFLSGFWINPLRYPDFGWAWLTRLLVNIGNQLTIVYLLFFLRDVIRYPDPAQGVLILTGLYSVMVIIMAVLVGRWSDRVGKRKPFVIGSSATIACAALIMTFFPVWPGALAGAVVLGLGFGAYLAVDFALLTQVLPSAADRGKDMGVINIANSLPQVIAPGLAALAVLQLGGYRTLFILAAVIGVAGAFFVVKIKGVD